MKKLILTIALALATFTAANAQFGIIGGYTTSNTKLSGSTFTAELKNANLWHAGIAYKIEMGPIFTLQPALVYQTKGSVVNADVRNLQTNTGYVELEIGAQVGIDLLAFRPFFLLEPFIGYGVVSGEKFSGTVTGMSYDDVNKYLNDAKNKFEVGFGVGGGVEIFDHVQLSVQWFMNVGKLYNEDKLNSDSIYSVVTSGYKDVKNYQGIKVTVGIFF
ncbi:MAG: outer membrane beta-barrel protein [Bacteroidales bacterium]|nr:outer membrane beta-barrel protein [Bacteroidales bacterium]